MPGSNPKGRWPVEEPRTRTRLTEPSGCEGVAGRFERVTGEEPGGVEQVEPALVVHAALVLVRAQPEGR